MVNTESFDSILTATDTNFINNSELYKVGEGLQSHGIAMAEHPYVVAKDDYLIGGLMLLFFVMALTLYRNRTIILYRLKDFFTTKRTYSEENVNENNNDAYTLFFLISITALSISIVLFDYIAIKEGFSKSIGIPYWIFAAGYVGFVVFIYIKAWLYTLINWTFFDHESGTKWISGYLLVTALTAFCFFPLSLTVVMVESTREIVSWALLFVYILYETVLFFKMFVNFGNKKRGYLLIFLYFCSVEVIPAIVMSRITMWAIDSFIITNIL